MFRIKTDIRQYKCETKDKVEKLIRNWVIRPNDLIYDADGKEWAPIGEHPGFVRLFGMLDEQEKNMPDTVVTRREKYTPADDEPEEPAPDDAPDEEPPEEVTQLVGRPVGNGAEADSDARSTDVFDQEEIAESVAAEAPKPPKAPAGVETPNRDEVTMMTERTLEMLKITDEDEASNADPVSTDKAADADDGDEAEDAQDVDEDPADAEDESAEDAKGEDEDEAEESEESEDDDEEITGVRERSAKSDESEDEPEDADGEAATREEVRQKVLESGPKLGRHDLPEELFATNEISSPQVQEHLKRLDELGELDPSDPSDATVDEARESGDWPVRLEEDSGVDEAWDFIAEDLRTTEELDDGTREELQEKSSPDDGHEGDNFDDDDEWSDDTPEPEIKQKPGEFVSDGYKMALPFPVRPTADDIRRGVPQGRVSRALKDRTYPPPQPKVPGEVHHRTFDMTKKPPRDRTMMIVAVMAFIVFMIAIVVASC